MSKSTRPQIERHQSAITVYQSELPLITQPGSGTRVRRGERREEAAVLASSPYVHTDVDACRGALCIKAREGDALAKSRPSDDRGVNNILIAALWRRAACAPAHPATR